ncbi:MAG: hypothetical protein O2967_11215 [Proteobacteria bacterium]|nr:hypothetical protein [Pseudomonadota bacterium]
MSAMKIGLAKEGRSGEVRAILLPENASGVLPRSNAARARCRDYVTAADVLARP